MGQRTSRSGTTPTAPADARGRGRPIDAAKLAAVRAAAESLFKTRGFDGVAIEEIAAAAGVSKVTIYKHFGGKDELFRQAVEAKCAQYWPEVVFDTQVRTDLKLRLRSFGIGFVGLVTSADVVSFFRLMAMQARDGSDLSQRFWEAGPERTLQRLAHLLDAAQQDGELRRLDPVRAAKQFITLLQGEYQLKCILGVIDAPGRATIKRHVDEAVDVFLRMYAA
ncbi:MAG: TetR/AcrR family transcriptional regulator [Sinimarinibacterium sp.]|jgi:TetR/AcrR family transcriptional repressor of mexJK operon